MSSFVNRVKSVSVAALHTQTLTTILARIVVSDKTVDLYLERKGLMSLLCGKVNPESTKASATSEPLVLRIAAELRTCRGEKRIILPDSEVGLTPPRHALPLVKAVSRAHEWIQLLMSGECKDLNAISKRAGLDQRYVSRILPLAFLVPEIVEAVLDGRQRPETTIDELRDLAAQSWAEQRSLMRLSS